MGASLGIYEQNDELHPEWHLSTDGRHFDSVGPPSAAQGDRCLLPIPPSALSVSPSLLQRFVGSFEREGVGNQ